MSFAPIDINAIILKASKFLPPQGPLKEFVAQNTLKGFLDLEFHDGLRRSAATFWCLDQTIAWLLPRGLEHGFNH